MTTKKDIEEKKRKIEEIKLQIEEAKLNKELTGLTPKERDKILKGAGVFVNGAVKVLKDIDKAIFPSFYKKKKSAKGTS